MINATLRVWLLLTFAAPLGVGAKPVGVVPGPVILMAVVLILVPVVMWLVVVRFSTESAGVAKLAM
jgi:hypothetical protein